MRFSSVATLVAAPLALASSLQHDLVARGALLAERANENTNSKAANNNNNNNNGNANGNNNGGNTVIIQQAQQQSITEVIVIWVNNGGGAATQTLNTVASIPPAAVAASTAAPAAAAAVTHQVTVGGTALTYSPDSVVAAVGDMVVFTFMSANHTATQSAFGTPCEALVGGMDSGFMANPNNSIVPAPQMAMQVTVATPIWFYCKQKGHCGKGMTFSINPDVPGSTTGNKTQAAFQALAIAQNGTGSTAVIAGGAAAASSAPAVVASAAPPAASAAAGGAMVAGTGTTGTGGVCTCSCLCGAAAFPNAAVQGVGAFGGVSGAMPMSALEVVVA